MEFLQKTGKAFLGGGIAAVLTQSIFMLLQPLPVSPYAQTLISLLIMGVIGATLFLLNIYPRLEQWFGFGAMLPICGLPAAIAGNIVRQREKGENATTALKKGTLPVIAVLLTGFCFSLCFALITALF